MAIKLTGQLGFVDAVVAGAVGGNAALDRLSDLVKWYRFEKGMSPQRSWPGSCLSSDGRGTSGRGPANQDGGLNFIRGA